MFKPISREEYHKILWKEMYGKDDCPFCKIEEQIATTYRKWKYWCILYNLSSYSWDHRHLIAVPYEHIKFSTELKYYHLRELSKIYKISVEHLHIHFLVWKLQWKFLRKMLEMQGYPIKQDLTIN